MFSEIERAYQKSLSEKRFWNYYRPRGLVAMVLAVVAVLIFHCELWLVTAVMAVILLLLVGNFFYQDMKLVAHGQKAPRSLPARFTTYEMQNQKLRRDTLVAELQKHHIASLEDLQLAINFYSAQRPVTAKTGLLEWVLSIVVTLASIVALAYDDQLGSVNQTKLIGVVWPTVQLLLIIIIPIMLIGFISGKVFFSHAKIDSILIEDLSYIYVNFDEYAELLQK